MTMIVNPGTRVGGPGQGWTNTAQAAQAEAERWLAGMRSRGMTDVELLDESEEREGRWVFTFRHRVAGATATVETHGIDDLDAYQEQHLFPPRVYWRGDSSAEPRLEDFAAEGSAAIRTFRPVGDQEPVWSLTRGHLETMLGWPCTGADAAAVAAALQDVSVTAVVHGMLHSGNWSPAGAGDQEPRDG